MLVYLIWEKAFVGWITLIVELAFAALLVGLKIYLDFYEASKPRIERPCCVVKDFQPTTQPFPPRELFLTLRQAIVSSLTSCNIVGQSESVDDNQILISIFLPYGFLSARYSSTNSLLQIRLFSDLDDDQLSSLFFPALQESLANFQELAATMKAV